MKKLLTLLVLLTATLGLAGCETSADRVAYNLSQEAEEFRVLRRIVYINALGDKAELDEQGNIIKEGNYYLFELIGFCSVESTHSALRGSIEVTCKNGIDSYEKHYLGVSDNTPYLVEQLEGIDVPQYHKQIIFAPQAILPIPEIVGDNLGE